MGSAFGAEQIFRYSSISILRQRVKQARLHHVNIDLRDVVLPKLFPHFCFKFPGVDSRRDIKEEHHLSLVLVERGTLKSAVVGNKQRLHHTKNRVRIYVVVEPDPDPAARV